MASFTLARISGLTLSSGPFAGLTVNLTEQAALREVQGTYGIAVVCRDEPDTLVVARKGSPLIIGVGKEEYVVASDASAIVEHTTQVIYLGRPVITRVDLDVPVPIEPNTSKSALDELAHAVRFARSNDEIVRLIVNQTHISVRPATLVTRAMATAIIGARHGRIGTRKRAGALSPPHHMYRRVVPPTNTATVVSITMSKKDSRSRRRIVSTRLA